MDDRNETERIATWIAELAESVFGRSPLASSSSPHPWSRQAGATERLASEIMRHRNVSIPHHIIAKHPSPRLLADWMWLNADGIYDPIIRFSDGNAPETLVCVHPVSGVGTVFKHLADLLPPRFRTFALHARGLNPGEKPYTDFDKMVSHYADRVVEISGDKQLHLLGWSFGGHIAAAIANELERRGRSIGLLMLIDSWISRQALCEHPPPLPSMDQYLRERYALFLPQELARFEKMNEETRFRELLKELGKQGAFNGRAERLPLPTIKRMFHVAFHLDRMFRRRRPQTCSARTLLVRAADSTRWEADVVDQWKQLTRHLVIEDLPHNHLTMLVNDDSVKTLASIVDRQCGMLAGEPSYPQ